MTEEQFKQSVTIINYLWTIGVISFDDACKIIAQIQSYRSLEIINEMRTKK